MRVIVRISGIAAIALALACDLAAQSTSAATNREPAAVAQAESLLARKLPQQAVSVLTAYLQDHATDDSARLLLAETLLSMGQSQAAQEQYKTLLKSAPNNYIALARLGELAEQSGRFEEAEPLLARAVKHSRGEPQLRTEWAETLASLHRFREASQALAGVAAPRGHDERIAFFRLKAAIAEGMGNSVVATSNMESALALQPDDGNLQLATAAALLQANKPERAAALAEAVYAQTQDRSAGLMVLQARLASHKDTQAILQSLRALPLPAERALALRQEMAETLIAQGKFADAIVDLKAAVAIAPENYDLSFNLALAQFRAGQTKEAMEMAEKCKALHDSGELEDLLGDIEEAEGDNLAAVRSYQAAVSLEPKNEDYQISLALEFLRHRNFAPAKLVLTQAQAVNPKSWRVQLMLGMVEYFTGTKAAASPMLLQAADLAPQPELVLRYLGDVELDETTAPDAPAVARICGFARRHPEAAREQFYCEALQLHSDYASHDTSHLNEIVQRLTAVARRLPEDARPHCELGRAYTWLEEWNLAVRESQACAAMDPDSAQAHYRLARLYRQVGQRERFRQELERFKQASQELADQNEQHEKTLKTFVYTLQNPR